MNPLLQSSSALLVSAPASTFLVGLIRFAAAVGPLAEKERLDHYRTNRTRVTKLLPLLVVVLLPAAFEVSLDDKVFLLLFVEVVDNWDFDRGKIVEFALVFNVVID